MCNEQLYYLYTEDERIKHVIYETFPHNKLIISTIPTKVSNLTKNEQNFLANSTVKRGLNILAISKKQDQLTISSNKAFFSSVELGKLVADSVEYMKTVKAKEQMSNAGIKWTQLDLAEKGFGIKKAWFYKLVKVGKMDALMIMSFQEAIETLVKDGYNASLTVAELIKFSKLVIEGDYASAVAEYVANWIAVDEDAFVGEVESEESEESEEDVQVEMLSDIFGMNFKDEDGDNVHVRVDASGRMMTTNSVEQIQEAIAYLTSKLK